MMRRRTRLRAAALLTVLATAGLTGCGSSGKSGEATTVSGSCALDQKYADVSPLTSGDLRQLLGKGSYRVEGNLRGGTQGAVPDAGACSYARSSKPDELLVQVGVNRKTDLFGSVTEARALQKKSGSTAIPHVDGFIVADPGSGPGSGDHGPLAVVFDGSRTITVQVVSGASSSGSALTTSLGDVATRVATYLRAPLSAAGSGVR